LSARRIAKRGGARKEGGDGGKGSPLASRRFVVGKIGCFFPLLDSLTMHASNDLGVSLARRIGADCECNVPSRQRPIRAPAGVQDRGEEAGGGRRGQGIFCLLSSLSPPTVPLSSERRLPPFPPPFSSKGELCSLSLTVCKACGISWAPSTPLRGKRERAKQRDREKMAGRREKTGNNGEERRAGVEKRKKGKTHFFNFAAARNVSPITPRGAGRQARRLAHGTDVDVVFSDPLLFRCRCHCSCCFIDGLHLVCGFSGSRPRRGCGRSIVRKPRHSRPCQPQPGEHSDRAQKKRRRSKGRSPRARRTINDSTWLPAVAAIDLLSTPTSLTSSPAPN
jgi:hypothetical protein